MRRMSEMVEPSKSGTIRPLLKDEHSSLYDMELEGRYDDNMRIDIPWEYSQKMGFGHDKTFVHVHLVEDGLMLSSEHQPIDSAETFTPTFRVKNGGSPRSDKLHDMIDDLFIMMPCGYGGFDVGNDITFEYHKQVPDGLERHVMVRHAKD